MSSDLLSFWLHSDSIVVPSMASGAHVDDDSKVEGDPSELLGLSEISVLH